MNFPAPFPAVSFAPVSFAALPTESIDVQTASRSVSLWFTQTATGEYLSFCGLPEAIFASHLHQIIGQPIADALFRPTEPDLYCQRLLRVIKTRRTEAGQTSFWWNGVEIAVNFVMSAIVELDDSVRSVLVQGNCELHPVLSVPANLDITNRYHLLLTQMSWSIRRTLELPTIWQQTVDGLGNTLNIERCTILSLNEDAGLAKIEAEYCAESGESWRGQELKLSHEPTLRKAIALLRPSPLWDELEGNLALDSWTDQSPGEIVLDSDSGVVVDRIESTDGRSYHRISVATGYQDEVNGIIVLWRLSSQGGWSESEQMFVEELADQVGTAIAHAQLFNRQERLNHALVRKQEEYERAAEQAEEASRRKSEFLANTSHELRTPLNGMIGFLKLILDGMADDPEEQQEFLEESLKSAEHLLDIINDVLDLAKIEAGKLQIELSPIALNDVLDQLKRAQSNSAERKNLYFDIELPQTRDDVMVYANYKRLYQVLLNLVGNAIKFTHEGGVTISTEFIKRRVMIQNHECPGLIMIRVADTGIGVSLEKQDRLFQSFSQIDGSTTRRYGGTGLGLAISQTLINAMGGEVNFYSMGEGLGSNVTFTIPLFQEPIA